MRNISLKGLSFALVVMLGLCGAQSSLASPIDRSGLFDEIEKQQVALNRIGEQIDAAENGIVEVDELLSFIKKTFEETGNPDLVLDELDKADQALKEVEDGFDSILKELASISETLKKIEEISREFDQPKLETELKNTFALLEATGKQFNGANEKVVSVRKAVEQITENIFSALTAVGRSDLQSIDESGVEANIVFVDDGTTLMVVGTAAGLDPAETYFSNVYDIGSASEGPGACVPSIFDPEDPDFIIPTMFLGFWEVDKDGNGRLCAINTNDGADFVPLDKIGTVSVRLFIAPPPAPGAPPVTDLVACGRVATLN